MNEGTIDQVFEPSEDGIRLQIVEIIVPIIDRLHELNLILTIALQIHLPAIVEQHLSVRSIIE